MARVFVDSNIWLYAKLAGGDSLKSERAIACLLACDEVVISSQIVLEVGVNLLKKGKLPEARVRLHLTDLLDASELIAIDRAVIQTASDLRSTYACSYWDSTVIAAALESGCNELWSEDLQHGQVIKDRLRVINPLLANG